MVRLFTPVNSTTYKALFERVRKTRKIGHKTKGGMAALSTDRVEMIRFRADPGKNGATGPLESSRLEQPFSFQKILGGNHGPVQRRIHHDMAGPSRQSHPKKTFHEKTICSAVPAD